MVLATVKLRDGAGRVFETRQDLFVVDDLAGQRQFGGMQIFELSPQHRLLALGHAAHAAAGTGGKWLLSDYRESRFEGDNVTTQPPAQRVLESNVSAGFLGLAVEDPKQLTGRQLWRLIEYF